MTADQIRNLATATPFRPFRVNMASRKSVDVPHLDFMSLSPTGRTLIVYGPAESFEIIDVLLVTSFETFAKDGARKVRRKKSRS